MRRRRNYRGSGSGGSDLDWGRWLLAGALAILLSYGLGYLMASFLLFPAPAAGAVDGVLVPKVVGLDLREAETELEALGLAVEETTTLPHPTERAGTILAQSPLPGQQLLRGAGVRLAVSDGRARATVPDVTGLPIGEASALVERLGFEVERRDETSGVAAGMVLGVIPEPGSMRDLPARVTLLVSAPPARVLPDTAAEAPEPFTDPAEAFGAPTDSARW